MSQGTGNPKQNLENDLCILRRLKTILRSRSSLISIFTEEALGSWLAYSGWQGPWQDCTEVPGWSEFLMGLHIYLFVLASAMQPVPRNLVTVNNQYP